MSPMIHICSVAINLRFFASLSRRRLRHNALLVAGSLVVQIILDAHLLVFVTCIDLALLLPSQ